MSIFTFSKSCSNSHARSWIILIFAALSVIFLGGKRRAFGSFVAEFHKEFNTTLLELNWIGDSYSALGYMTIGLSISIIMYFRRRYGLFQFIGAVWILMSCFSSAYVPNPNWLFLTHTLFHGIGSSLIISVTGLVVNEHFDKKHRYHILATTLVSGGSVASILFINLFSALIQFYGWRHALIILGILYFVVIGAASFIFKRKEDNTDFENKNSCKCDGTITGSHIPVLILWFIDRVMTSVVTYGLLMNLTVYEYHRQKSLLSSTILTTLFASGEAVTYLIGAIITAITKTFFKEKLRYILLVTSLSMSICLILLEFYRKDVIILYILCFFAGFSLGPSITFLFPAGEELTRLPGHVAYPISLGGMGFGMIISPLLTAQILMIFRHKWFFFIQGCLIFVKFSVIFIIIIILYFKQKQMDDLENIKENPKFGDILEESFVDENKPIYKGNK